MQRVTSFWRGGRVEETLQLCLNRCRRARNGECEDRGACREGMDCSDCGVRSYRPNAAQPRRRAVWRRWVTPSVLADVTLCTLMTADRVPSLHRLASSWESLLSVAYLAEDFEADAAAGFRLLEHSGRPVPHADMLTLSVVEDRSYRQPQSRFPFNLLRNIAVAAAPTDFIALVDVDFVAYPQRRPGCASCHAAARLRLWLPLLRLSPNLALVMPAFDANPLEAASSSRDRMGGVHSKRAIARLMKYGHAESL